MKKYLFFLAGGLIAGVLLSLLYFNLYFSNYFVSQAELENNLKAYILANQSPSPSPGIWQSIVSGASLNTVAIESFSHNKVVSKGSGIIISADGLIATTTDVTRPAQIYQITFNSKVLKGKVVYRNIAKNISFLKVEETGLNAAGFVTGYEYKSGAEIILTGKTVELSKTADFSQRALINFVVERNIILDTNADSMLNGSKAVNNQSQLIGMVYVRNNKVYLISSDIVEQAINEYLTQAN